MIKDKINKIHNSSEMCLLLHDTTTNWVMSLVFLWFKMICWPYELSAEGLLQYQDFSHRTRILNIKLCYDGLKWFLPWCVHLESCLWLEKVHRGDVCRRMMSIPKHNHNKLCYDAVFTQPILIQNYMVGQKQTNSQIHYTWKSVSWFW